MKREDILETLIKNYKQLGLTVKSDKTITMSNGEKFSNLIWLPEIGGDDEGLLVIILEQHQAQNFTLPENLNFSALVYLEESFDGLSFNQEHLIRDLNYFQWIGKQDKKPSWMPERPTVQIHDNLEVIENINANDNCIEKDKND